MSRPRRASDRLAVLDTETTGFSKADRVVEIAVITVVRGAIKDEFDTLIQPQRDPGPVHIHGITPAMLQADGHLDAPEQRWLDETADAVGLSDDRRADLHSRYYASLKAQILTDGVVTREEVELARSVAGSLSLAFEELTTTEHEHEPVRLQTGARVCFTGTATVNGRRMGRDALEGLAESFGLVATTSVTRNCDVLVAADPLSQSGKAGKARDYGIPTISTEDFLGILAG